MLSLEFVKTLLKHSFWEGHKAMLSEDLMPREHTAVYRTIETHHTNNTTDITPQELKQLHLSANPTMSRAAQEAFGIFIKNLESAEVFDDKVSAQILKNKVSELMANNVAQMMLDIGENKGTKTLEDVQQILERLKKIKNDVPEKQTSNVINLEELFAQKSKSLRWKFNYPDLQHRLTGIGGGYFGVIAARPDVGKTSFYMAITCAPDGFIEQGANVHIIGNEESVERLRLRAASAIIGVAEDEIKKEPKKYQEQVNKATNLHINDGFGWTMGMLDNYVSNHDVDILIVDQLDKMHVKGNFATDTDRLKAIYIQARDIAKKHDCGVIGICQAGASAHNKLYFGFECLDGSKTGKAAECDWCLCIGAEFSKDGDTGYRIGNLPKNKLTGSKKPFSFTLETETSRIHA